MKYLYIVISSISGIAGLKPTLHMIQFTKKILLANNLDVEDALSNSKDDAFVDRLRLDDERIDGIIDTLNNIVKLPDPVGTILDTWKRPNGLEISRVRTPLGTIGIIFESRPNVSADASALSIKSGNAVVLRSGSDSLRSSQAIVDCFGATFFLPEPFGFSILHLSHLSKLFGVRLVEIVELPIKGIK